MRLGGGLRDRVLRFHLLNLMIFCDCVEERVEGGKGRMDEELKAALMAVEVVKEREKESTAYFRLLATFKRSKKFREGRCHLV